MHLQKSGISIEEIQRGPWLFLEVIPETSTLWQYAQKRK